MRINQFNKVLTGIIWGTIWNSNLFDNIPVVIHSFFPVSISSISTCTTPSTLFFVLFISHTSFMSKISFTFSLGDNFVVVNFTFIFSTATFYKSHFSLFPSYPALSFEKDSFSVFHADIKWKWQSASCKLNPASNLPEVHTHHENVVSSSSEGAKTWFPLKAVFPITGRNVINTQNENSFVYSIYCISRYTSKPRRYCSFGSRPPQ